MKSSVSDSDFIYSSYCYKYNTKQQFKVKKKKKKQNRCLAQISNLKRGRTLLKDALSLHIILGSFVCNNNLNSQMVRSIMCPIEPASIISIP